MKKVILAYTSITIAIASFFFISDFIKNKIFFSFIFATIITALLILNISKGKKIDPEEGFIRYTMLCHDCGWEWMSNITTKIPQKCPNCNEKNKLEVIGWRKIKTLTKGDKDLRSFFKQQSF